MSDIVAINDTISVYDTIYVVKDVTYVSKDFTNEHLLEITNSALNIYQDFFTNYVLIAGSIIVVVTIALPLLLNFLNRKSARKLKKEVKETKKDLQNSKNDLGKVKNELNEKENNLKQLIYAYHSYNLSLIEEDRSIVYSIMFYLEHLLFLYDGNMESFNKVIVNSRITIVFKIKKIKEYSKDDISQYKQLNNCLNRLKKIKSELDVNIIEHIDIIINDIEELFKEYEKNTDLKI